MRGDNQTAGPPLDRARSAFAASRWADACAAFLAADARTPLDADDLDRLAAAAYLTGRDELGIEARTRAHHGHLEQRAPIAAAGSAFWLAFTILDRPDQRAQAGGWLARVRRLLDDAGAEGAERGLLRCAEAFQQLGRGDLETARETFADAARIGSRTSDADLLALARHGEGRVLIRQGCAADGLAMLDEVMIAVTGGEVGPLVAGVVYCSVISACHERFDLSRAREWTLALASWCAAHPDMMPFRGQCLVRRSELMQLDGDWAGALDEAVRACAAVTDAHTPDAGMAFYQLAEVHRMRGAVRDAEESYRRAALAGRCVQPGLALLRLSQGDMTAAVANIRQGLDEARTVPARAWMLRTSVEILAAANDRDACRASADELSALAAEFDSPCPRALAAHAEGVLALAGGHARPAHTRLREAATLWSTVGAPYEAARARMLIGVACRTLGDDEGAGVEFEAAETVFERLGARPDLTELRRLTRQTPRASTGLTGREVEVLRLVASGRTNKAIAAELTISDKTVARHLANIFTKLDLTSRSAATAYAYRHKLL